MKENIYSYQLKSDTHKYVTLTSEDIRTAFLRRLCDKLPNKTRKNNLPLSNAKVTELLKRQVSAPIKSI